MHETSKETDFSPNPINLGKISVSCSYLLVADCASGARAASLLQSSRTMLPRPLPFLFISESLITLLATGRKHAYTMMSCCRVFLNAFPWESWPCYLVDNRLSTLYFQKSTVLKQTIGYFYYTRNLFP